MARRAVHAIGLHGAAGGRDDEPSSDVDEFPIATREAQAHDVPSGQEQLAQRCGSQRPRVS